LYTYDLLIARDSIAAPHLLSTKKSRAECSIQKYFLQPEKLQALWKEAAVSARSTRHDNGPSIGVSGSGALSV
jgi:hypothetical protein